MVRLQAAGAGGLSFVNQPRNGPLIRQETTSGESGRKMTMRVMNRVWAAVIGGQYAPAPPRFQIRYVLVSN